MSDRLPDNLRLLYSTFGENAIGHILPGDTFMIDGVEFVCQYSPGSTAERFYIVKNLQLVERYRQLCDQVVGGTIVELGIAEGGSTALLALLARPTRLVAIDLESERLEALDAFIEHRGLHEVVRPLFGVDQSDRERLAQLVDHELAGAPLDLVIDDCSHQYRPTRASFEALFPRLRPGGLYAIEDWNADHVMYDAVRTGLSDTAAPNHEELVAHFQSQLRDPAHNEATRQRDPLTRLAMELVVARSSLTDAIAEVAVDEFWITIRRGPGELDSSFCLGDHYHDHFGFVPPPRDGRV